jgi:hypothetical protein
MSLALVMLAGELGAAFACLGLGHVTTIRPAAPALTEAGEGGWVSFRVG